MKCDTQQRENAMRCDVQPRVGLCVALALLMVIPRHGALLPAPAVHLKATIPPLGPLPSTCPSRPSPHIIAPYFGAAVGRFPVWYIGFGGPHATLNFSILPTPHYVSGYGWGVKGFVAIAPRVHGHITLYGARLGDKQPLYFDNDIAGPRPVHVLAIDVDAERGRSSRGYGGWVVALDGLYLPGAGCYALHASWQGGSWMVHFSAGQ